MQKWHILGGRILLSFTEFQPRHRGPAYFPTFHHSIWLRSACRQHPFLMGEDRWLSSSRCRGHPDKTGISSHESLSWGKICPQSLPIGPVGLDPAACPHSSPKEGEKQLLAFSASLEGRVLQQERQWERAPLGWTTGTVWPVGEAASRLVWEDGKSVGDTCGEKWGERVEIHCFS